MKVKVLNLNLALINVAPPASGFDNFISAYILHGNKDAAIVDVGPSSGLIQLFAGLKKLDVGTADIKYIFATHIHLDHNGGLGEAIKHLPNASAVVHEKGRPHLITPEKLWERSRQTLGETAFAFGQPEPVPENKIIVAREGMKFDLGGLEIEVLLTPGHASHHLCFWNSRERDLFSGDAAGVYLRSIRLVRPDMPPPFNFKLALDSLDKLISLSPETICYTHFGCAGNAVQKLLSVKRRMILWGKIILEHLAEGHDWQTIYTEIKEKDRAFQRLDKLPADQRQTQLFFIKNNIEGFTGYFRKYGTSMIQNNREANSNTQTFSKE